MKSTMTLFAILAVLVFSISACQSRQARVDALQKEYDGLGAQFKKDCSAEYLRDPPTLSTKCADEKNKLEEVGKRLQMQRAKQ